MVTAALLRTWHISWGLPELYEEAYPLTISWKFWNWGNPGFDVNPHFFNYPAFSFYIHFIVQVLHYAIGHLFGMYPDLTGFQQAYASNKTVFVLLARLATVIFDLGSIGILFLLGKRLSNYSAAIIAAALLAINPLHIQHAHLVNVDTPLTFFTVLTIFFIYQIYHSDEIKWYTLAGMSIGVAASTKYNGALLFLILALSSAMRAGSLPKTLQGERIGKVLLALIVALVVFVVLNPYILLDYSEFHRDVGYEESHMATGHLGINPSASSAEFYFFQTLPASLGWFSMVVVAASLVVLILRRSEQHMILVAFLVLYVSVLLSWKMYADRYLLPIIPIVLLIGASGIVKLWDTILSSKRFIPLIAHSPAGSITGLVLITTLLAVEPLISDYNYHASLALPDTRAVAKEWILEHVQRGSLIATIPAGITFSEGEYNVFLIPFLSVNSERAAPFYDTRWYEDFDLVIGSGYDYQRYVQEPKRYREFIAYYDSLRRRMDLVFEIQPRERQPGSDIWLYKPSRAFISERFDSTLFQHLHDVPERAWTTRFLKNIGFMLIKKKKFGKAEQVIREELQYNADDLDGHRLLSEALFYREQYAEALSHVDNALRQSPREPELVGLRGAILLHLQREEEGEASLLKALELDDHLKGAYRALIDFYKRRNDKNNLVNILHRYLNVASSDSDQASMIRKQLEEVQQGN